MSLTARPAGARWTDRRAAAQAVIEGTAVETVPQREHYVGLVTRALAFAVDSAIINGLALLLGAVVGLALSVISIPSEVETVALAIGGVLYLLWLVGYFVVFWSTTGQTPGNRVFRFRVRPVAGERLLPRRALLRFIGLTLSALPLFAGFLLILVNDRRRGLHDLLARTVVVDVGDEESGGPPP
jgi:uncharacterized RDD family membrane protein YckC